MGLFILKRLGVMILTALCLTFVVFWLTNLDQTSKSLRRHKATLGCPMRPL